MLSFYVTLVVCAVTIIIVFFGISRLLWGAANRGTAENRRTAIMMIVVLLTWTTNSISMAYFGTMSLPVFLSFALLPLVFGSLASFHPAVARLLARVSLHELVFLQTYRVVGFIFVYLYYTTGELSREFAMNAGWGDVLTGVLAVPVGWMLLRKVQGSGTALIVWCLIGIGDLIVAPVSAVLYGAGNLFAFPLNTIPLFLGPPLGILLHIYALRIWQLSRSPNHLM